MNQQLNVKITSPNKIIYDSPADSVSSVNSQGPFDILPYHANFITIIENHTVIIRNNKDKQEFNFKRAIIYTNNNKVQIYTDI